LLAVGRPDGRLCCLAKSEAAVLLSIKQAAFIHNPDYVGKGSGPDIITIGHNPYKPNLGSVSVNITLPSSSRRKFIDEYLFEHISIESSVKAQIILKGISLKYHSNTDHLFRDNYLLKLPYGAHHIEPFNYNNKDKALLLIDKADETSSSDSIDNDPAVRSAFTSRLDTASREIQDKIKIVEHLYETRVASMERYAAFCVMFHTMAKYSCTPWLQVPWDIARSQSNLRVATTASPISAVPDDSDNKISDSTKRISKKLALLLSHHHVNF
jgi:hypothetical protein